MHFLLLLPVVVLLFFALVELSLSAISLALEQNGPFGPAILPSTGLDLVVLSPFLLDSAGQLCWALFYFCTFGPFKTRSTLQEGPLYHGYLLCVAFSL